MLTDSEARVDVVAAVAENPDQTTLRSKGGDAVDRAIDTIRYRIVCGDLAAGEQIRQEEMAEDLHLSRAPVREALRALAGQGLLQRRAHSGYFVMKRNTHELAQIYMMLEMLETWVMDTVQPGDADTITALKQLNDEMREYVPEFDWSPMVDLNRRFHFVIFRLSPLSVVVAELERLWTIAAPYIALKYATQAMRQKTVDQHEQLVSALDRGDLTLLSRRLAQHRSQRSTTN
jgi:DNA-binding GntR family transcriptional regulator